MNTQTEQTFQTNTPSDTTLTTVPSQLKNVDPFISIMRNKFMISSEKRWLQLFDQINESNFFQEATDNFFEKAYKNMKGINASDWIHMSMRTARSTTKLSIKVWLEALYNIKDNKSLQDHLAKRLSYANTTYNIFPSRRLKLVQDYAHIMLQKEDGNNDNFDLSFEDAQYLLNNYFPYLSLHAYIDMLNIIFFAVKETVTHYSHLFSVVNARELSQLVKENKKTARETTRENKSRKNNIDESEEEEKEELSEYE